jgi:hypothetical protein
MDFEPCIAAKAGRSFPLWVNRFASTSRGRPRNVRFTPNSVQTFAPQRNVTKCQQLKSVAAFGGADWAR